MEGTTKWFNDPKGFGFIVGDDGKDYFVHQSEIQMKGHRTLFEDQRVEFELGEDDKGRITAKDVKKIRE